MDEGGLSLNNRLQNSLSTLEKREMTIRDRINQIEYKSDVRSEIKDECRKVDDHVTTLSENSRANIEKSIKDLVKVINYKNGLKAKINNTQTNVLELKSIIKGVEINKDLGNNVTEGEDSNLKYRYSRTKH